MLQPRNSVLSKYPKETLAHVPMERPNKNVLSNTDWYRKKVGRGESTETEWINKLRFKKKKKKNHTMEYYIAVKITKVQPHKQCGWLQKCQLEGKKEPQRTILKLSYWIKCSKTNTTKQSLFKQANTCIKTAFLRGKIHKIQDSGYLCIQLTFEMQPVITNHNDHQL